MFSESHDKVELLKVQLAIREKTRADPLYLHKICKMELLNLLPPTICSNPD
eukprot:gene6740-16545_t